VLVAQHPRPLLIGLGVMGAWLAFAYVLPIVVFGLAYLQLPIPIPSLENMLFFGPQYMFSFRWLSAAGSAGQLLFQPLSAFVFGVVFWAVVAFAFAGVTRRLGRGIAVALAPLFIVAATIAVHYAFAQFGYRLMLDGP
jgi:type IV secretory pathway VirB6-like protein